MQSINSATLIEFIMLAQVCQFNLVNVDALVVSVGMFVEKMSYLYFTYYEIYKLIIFFIIS